MSDMNWFETKPWWTMKDVDTSDVHWLWLGLIRSTAFMAALPFIVLCIPILMVAMMGDNPDFGRCTYEKISLKVNCFAWWSWVKIAGSKRP
jgi:hypothetical protein